MQACPILLHDDARDNIFERLVESSQALEAVLQALVSPLADLV